MEYLNLGFITGGFALDGTLRIKSLTDQPEKRYKQGNKVFLFDPKTSQISQLTVVSYRSNGQFDLLKTFEIDTKEKADALKGFTLKVIKDNRDLEEGHYFFTDLVGCEIIDESDNVLGVVSVVEEFPSQITLRVKRQGNRDFFVPFLKEFIVNVDISKKKINIRVIEGML